MKRKGCSARTQSILRNHHQDVYGSRWPASLPYFHAYYQDDVAVVGINPIEVIAGSLPRRQRRFVEAWAEIHQEELIADWERLLQGEPPLPIAPLE